jgi:hypothetical protein
VAPGHPLARGESHDGVHASDLTDAEHTRGLQDELRRDSDADGRPCHGHGRQPLCLGPGGVTLGLSPGRTRPTPLRVYANVLSGRHTRHPRLGVTLGDSGSVGHTFLLEWVDHAQRSPTSSLLIRSEGTFFSRRRVAVSVAWAQKEPLVYRCVGHLAYTVTAQVLRAWLALSGVVDRLNLLTDRETGRPRGCGCIAKADDQAAQAALAGLQGTDVAGRPFNVDAARQRAERRPGRGLRGGRWSPACSIQGAAAARQE